MNLQHYSADLNKTISWSGDPLLTNIVPTPEKGFPINIAIIRICPW